MPGMAWTLCSCGYDQWRCTAEFRLWKTWIMPDQLCGRSQNYARGAHNRIITLSLVLKSKYMGMPKSKPLRIDMGLLFGPPREYINVTDVM